MGRRIPAPDSSLSFQVAVAEDKSTLGLFGYIC